MDEALDGLTEEELERRRRERRRTRINLAREEDEDMTEPLHPGEVVRKQVTFEKFLAMKERHALTRMYSTRFSLHSPTLCTTRSRSDWVRHTSLEAQFSLATTYSRPRRISLSVHSRMRGHTTKRTKMTMSRTTLVLEVLPVTVATLYPSEPRRV